MLNKILAVLLFLFSFSCSAEQTVLEVIPLFNRSAAELQPLIAPLLAETDYLTGKDYSLIVKTTPARLAEIKNLVKKLDTALTNLSIRVMQSKDRTAEQMNADANIDVVIPINQPGKPKGRINGRYQQNQRQQTHNSEQMLRTLEGQTAYIKMGSNNPIRYTTVYDSGYGQRVVSSNTQYIEATTGFAVLPRLNGEQVTLEISPWSDQMKNNGVTDTQSVQTTIRAKLGEWVEIGTINEESQSSGNGFLSVEQGSGQSIVHILVQVEKAF